MSRVPNRLFDTEPMILNKPRLFWVCVNAFKWFASCFRLLIQFCNASSSSAYSLLVARESIVDLYSTIVLICSYMSLVSNPTIILAVSLYKYPFLIFSTNTEFPSSGVILICANTIPAKRSVDLESKVLNDYHVSFCLGSDSMECILYQSCMGLTILHRVYAFYDRYVLKRSLLWKLIKVL